MARVGWSALRAWLARIGGAFAPYRRDRELDEEPAAHLAFHIEENIRRGMTPEEARREALLRTGGVASAKEA